MTHNAKLRYIRYIRRTYKANNQSDYLMHVLHVYRNVSRSLAIATVGHLLNA